MTLKKYGVLKGTVTGHKRDADDDHYQILVTAGTTVHRIAVNVKSSAPNASSTLLFIAQSKLPDDFIQGLGALGPGYTKLPSKAGGLALDASTASRWKTATCLPLPRSACLWLATK